MYSNEAALKERPSGKFAISSPYNAAFVEELKKSVPSARWSGGFWVINASGKEQAEKLLAQYYPSDDQLQKVRISWSLDRDDPKIDGVSLASVSRDCWSWRRDCPIDFKIVSQDLESGGSRKNPGLYGELVIETKIRPGAKVEPSANVEILEDGENPNPNPLADFSDKELLAELERRGVK